MPIFDTLTRRKRLAARTSQGDIYTYDSIPPELRTQVAYIWRGTLGGYQEMSRFDFDGPPRSNRRWEMIRDVVARERGVFSLSSPQDNAWQQCMTTLLQGDTEAALEIIEISFRVIENAMSKLSDSHRQQEGLTQSPDDAISELNQRLKEHGVGYRYHAGLLVRIDSELLHAEVTLPALSLLQSQGFEGALEEFMGAHEHYRKGEAKDANVDALNALESTLKTICDKRRWKYPGGATASDLVRVVVNKGLIPPELQTQFDHLIRAMSTGLPPMRHNYGGHGQGAEIKKVEDHLAAYSLHLMAANIVLLIEAENALSK